MGIDVIECRPVTNLPLQRSVGSQARGVNAVSGLGAVDMAIQPLKNGLSLVRNSGCVDNGVNHERVGDGADEVTGRDHCLGMREETVMW